MSESQYTLGKLGKRARMLDLLENGTVFMQQVRTFRGVKDVARGDENEGALLRLDASAPSTRINMRIGTKRIPIPRAFVQIYGPHQDHAVYCMYSMIDGEGGPLPDDPRTPLTGLHKRLPEFGDTLVVFHDTAEFVNRLKSAAQNAGYELEHGLVEYVPQYHAGPMGPFRKLDTFRYQLEWRFITTTAIQDESLTLKLGSLHDIAMLYGRA
jgi:hypothetical protein